VDSRYRATAYGTMNFVQQITGGFAVYATGLLRDLRIETSSILLGAAGVQVLGSGMLLLLKPRKRVR
jgi:hypothetical protein